MSVKTLFAPVVLIFVMIWNWIHNH